MEKKAGRKPLAETVVRGGYKAPEELKTSFSERCQVFGNNLESTFIRIGMKAFIELPQRTVDFFWGLSNGDEVEASQVAMRWIQWGEERERRNGDLQLGAPEGTALAAEGGAEMPDPEARAAIAEVRSELEEERETNRSFREQVLSALRRLGGLKDEERPVAPQRRRTKKK